MLWGKNWGESGYWDIMTKKLTQYQFEELFIFWGMKLNVYKNQV